MKISERTISVLAKVITGDNPIAPYKSGPKLVRLFNELGANDVYGQGFPSRWAYTEDKIRELNNNPQLLELFKLYLDPRDFHEDEFDISSVVDHLNKYLSYDGYEIIPAGKNYVIRELNGVEIPIQTPFGESNEINHIFIEEQIQKCDKKIFEGDFDGAITNARSLIEAVLIEIESELEGKTVQYDGDLVKLYRRVQAKLNLDPGTPSFTTPMKQILSGLTSIVNGLAGIRNEMSDAHARTYKPSKHHAKLAVNSAKTLTNFLFDTFSYQQGKRIVLLPPCSVRKLTELIVQRLTKKLATMVC